MDCNSFFSLLKYCSRCFAHFRRMDFSVWKKIAEKTIKKLTFSPKLQLRSEGTFFWFNKNFAQ